MSAKYKTSWNVYSAWNYEQEIEDLNRASEEGWQLLKGGCFHSRFVNDPGIRYRYQLDFQRPEDMVRYIETFREQGWEYINSTFNGWNYFRKIYDPSQPEEAYEIFTDRESLHEMNGRWVRIAMIIGILIGIMTLIALWRLVRRLCLPSTAQFLTLFIESAFLLRGAFIMNSQDMNRKRAGEKNLLTVFFLALTIGLFSFMILENARPHTQSLMISGDIDEPINGERFNDFKIYYPDFYYMDLEAEAAEPMTLEIVNSDGEAFWSQTGTRIGGDRIRIRLPRGEYCFSLTCTTGYRVDYTLN